jgi:hypothetical protein
VLHELGWRRLKDIDRPEHLHALVEAAAIEPAVRRPQPRPCDWAAPVSTSGSRGARASSPSRRAVHVAGCSTASLVRWAVKDSNLRPWD